MCQGHDHNHEEEIDLVDLLGVIIKRRRLIVWFIICFTVFTSALIFLKEYKSSAVSLKRSFAASNTLTTQNDTVLASYIFLSKSDKQDGYKTFVSSLLFPAIVDAPTFEIQRSTGLSVNYLFISAGETKRFLDKYNGFVDELLKLNLYKNNMSEEVSASCAQFKSTTTDSLNLVKTLFSNSKNIVNCNLYYAYFGLIQGKLKYATGSNVDDYYYPFISSSVKDAKTSKLKPVADKEFAEIKTEAKRNFNTKKVIKYSAVSFILSVIFSLVIAFVFEFWTNNRKRISGYWR